MRYLCLVYDDRKKWDAPPGRATDDYMDEHLAYDEALRDSGQLIAAAAVQPVQAATVRVRNGRLSIVDGAAAAAKEHLGGFFLIEARDLNHAIHAAAKSPAARTGSVEVRPVRELAAEGITGKERQR